MRKFLAYFIPILLALAVGALGSYIQGNALVEWYPYLIKSPVTPPAILFPIAWGVLYVLMGVSVGTMLVKGDMSVVRLWLLQLLLNFLWSVCFFALRSPLVGLLVILALDVTVCAYIIHTMGRRSVAAWLFVPYLLWLVFATYLNGYIYVNNRKSKEKIAMNANYVKFSLPALSYAADALAPTMSKETVDYHYGKHFKTYVDNTNRLIEGTSYEGMGLEEIVKKSDGALFNNAAQALNHRIYFDGLTPVQKVIPKELEERLVRDFGSVEEFNKKFTDTAVGVFGSGWVWLAEDSKGKLLIVPTKDADNPLRHHLTPLMCIDVWEHAYYLDYQNRRADFVREYMKLIDWDKVTARSRRGQ
jgi:Fe-Mn family superoxide dismutase